MSRSPASSPSVLSSEPWRELMRSIGIDVHRDFCEVAIAEGGSVRTAGRVASEPEALALLARSLGPDEEVAIEATANAVAIARIIEPHVRRVVLANPKAVREKARRAKTDRIDAKLLARLLAVGFLDEVWTPDDRTQTRRRLITRRCALVRARTRAKNQVHAVLARNLLGRPPVTDLFGGKGRAWLAAQIVGLPLEEGLSGEGSLRQGDLLAGGLEQLDLILGADALSDPDALRLMTIPGVSVVTAIALLAAIGDIGRFATPRQLVADPGTGSAGPSVRHPAGQARTDQQAGRRRGPRPARRGGLADDPQPRPAARLPRAHRRATRQQDRDRRDRTQARRDRVASAQPRRAVRVRAPSARSREAAPHRAAARRPAPPGTQPERTSAAQNRSAASRARDRRPARARLPTDGRRLAGLPAGRDQDRLTSTDRGRGRDTGARISQALEGQAARQTP